MARGGWRLDGKRVQKERIALGWTVEQLAQKAGLSDRRLRDIEKDSEGIAMQATILCLAKCLGVPAAELARPPEEAPRTRPTLTLAPSRAAPSPSLPVIGPLHEQTQLERLVAIERTTAPRPTLATARGPVEPLTAKRMQDIFTAYAVRAGSLFYATGEVITDRGLPASECALFDAKAGIASRVMLFTPIHDENGLSITVHTRLAEHTLFLQEKKGAFATVVVRVVLAPEPAVQQGTGFTFFQSKTPREWALVVEEVREPTGPGGARNGPGWRKGPAKRASRRASA